ncbi:ubiquitin-related domain-containing protein [Ilyonectria destructans]|nr:ubiquitin-related domain-containing protein [Ilyonectria destructans]
MADRDDPPSGPRGQDEGDRRDDKAPSRDRDRDDAESSKPKKESKPAAAPAAPVGGGEEMIIVNINDRLGTKASIPCYASDRIKEFKILVAARIGREPHEILLKRQGERPFKDQLSLEDYGVSNGVQLDLEVDTGD